MEPVVSARLVLCITFCLPAKTSSCRRFAAAQPCLMCLLPWKQEKYRREQEKLKEEWEKAQREVAEEERKYHEEVCCCTCCT